MTVDDIAKQMTKPRITRVGFSDGSERWSVEIGQFAMHTTCFALACCYAATGELQRRFPEITKMAARGIVGYA